MSVRVCVDLDGTLDSWPYELGELMRSLRSAGFTVDVLTGVSGEKATQEDLDQKAAFLRSLGCDNCFDNLVLVPDPHPENKASYMREVGCDMLIDNNKNNAKAAADICIALVPWQTRVG